MTETQAIMDVLREVSPALLEAARAKVYADLVFSAILMVVSCVVVACSGLWLWKRREEELTEAAFIAVLGNVVVLAVLLVTAEQCIERILAYDYYVYKAVVDLSPL